MEVVEAVAFISKNHRAILSTTRKDGLSQMSPVLAVPDGNGKIVISSRVTAYKTKNLLRVPYAALCVVEDKWYGQWVQVEGSTEVVHQPEAMELLIDYYRRAAGETDWDVYRERMIAEQRVLLRLTVERVGPSVSG